VSRSSSCPTDRGRAPISGARDTKAQIWAELDELGEPKVRELLATKQWGDVGDKRALVVLWLDFKERSRRDAAEAAANRKARLALIISAISAMIAVVALIK
jgi:hypothetical protein